MKHYYFIGIGGIGMSGLAKNLLEEGIRVSGSDPVPNHETKALEHMGATFYPAQTADHITRDIDAVVISAAIPENNPELQQARSLGLPVLKRPELLNQIITKQKAIAITGTHGKTTTSSMLAEVFIAAGLDPTAIVGAEIASIGSNSRRGSGEYSVAEVCEYQRAFLDVHPYAAVITNIDADHLDCYKDIDDIKAAFTQFVRQIDGKGFLVYCGDDQNTTEVASKFSGEKINYGFSDSCQVVATDVAISEGDTTFVVGDLGSFTLTVPGRHNVLNALACIAVTVKVGGDIEALRASLASFKGAERRFQLLGSYHGAIVVDDYAHHPTEIVATLAAARDRYPSKRIIAVFQPHQHSRTRELLADFATSLVSADLVLIPEIYAVRDTKADIDSVSSRDIVNIINHAQAGKAVFFPDFEQTVAYLREHTSDNDLILTIGAGPVYQIGELLVKK